jgi:hypothetical protein
VPWNKYRVISHGPQALRDAVDQVLVVATWKVGAANASSKQNVAYECAFDFR